MIEKKSKVGRPTIDPEGPLGSKLGFRPTRKVRRYLDAQVESGEAVNLNAAIQVAVERGMMLEQEIRDQIIEEFGGVHNFRLGYVCARTALGVEHLHQELWTDDIPTFLNVLSAIKDVLRYYFSAVPKKLKPFDPKKSWNIRFWAYTAIAVSENLQKGHKLWWPLGQSSSAEEVDQIEEPSSEEGCGRARFVPSALVIDFPEKAKRNPNQILKMPLRFIELLWHADRLAEASRIMLLNSFEKIVDHAEARQLDINSISDEELIHLAKQYIPEPKNEFDQITVEETNRMIDAAFRSKPKTHEKASAQKYKQLVS